MNAPLELARRLSEIVNQSWASGEMLDKVTSTTQELLKFWFSEDYCSLRERNFHVGQRQAILNVIYLHEVMGVKTVLDYYFDDELRLMADAETLIQPKYQMPKYAVKMATGTGKTWVMHALLLWQMLNARHEPVPSGRFTKNFLIIAPGLIVYDRLLDAFCGRIERGSENRNFETNDFYINQDIFIPNHLRHEVFSFIQNNVVTKEDGIGRKTTSDGLIALTNWHLFENQTDEQNQADSDEVLNDKQLVDALLPIRPGVAAGNDLGMLDRRYLRGYELEYLANLSDIMVINDEAHHIHELRQNGNIEEVEWQKGLNAIAANKGERFFQVDFSATPYDQCGTGKNVRKIYFPHIVVDFDLTTAMSNGLVKTLLLDRRQELTALENLDFRAVRDERDKVCALSDGQRLMLRAGLTKLRILETEFTKLDEKKNPKMLVICEDTSVSPLVEQFLLDEQLQKEDVVTIDSNRKGEVTESEWKEIKTLLFDIDNYKSPKVIISVLMLREGFDVNNICVIVPLRSSEAPILLEQIIGRGLRLMWRENEYKEIKDENRRLVLNNHIAPKNNIDTLSVIEHPAFNAFYDNLLNNGLAAADTDKNASDSATGDFMRIALRNGYEKFDISWPVIIRDAEEEFADVEIDINTLEPFKLFPLENLRKALANDGEMFVSHESITQTTYGKYKVTANLFTSRSYNEYLQKMLHIVTQRFDKISAHKNLQVPVLQINESKVVGAMDRYIRYRLFGQKFNPFNGNDWKILLSKNDIVTNHIIEQLSRAIHDQQEQIQRIEAEVNQIKFSSVTELKMRESYSMRTHKTIYERQAYPSHGGGLEKKFMEYLDRDGEVESFIKITENQHTFAVISYMRSDGLMAKYHPDFVVTTNDNIYLIETKGNDKLEDKNVQLKRRAAVDWCVKINTLTPEKRMNREWKYILLPESLFYQFSTSGASITDICNMCEVTSANARGELF
ncbi:MAG: DEAD/DEAH box helicase family protein [Bacteroidales bacterium]|nr:DEAD/DEAH box helicase family protein [Bacteroidales bacterium]